MIFDVARHKFLEAVATLFILALVVVFSGVLLNDSSMPTYSGGGAPLGMVIGELQQSHSVIASLLSFILILHLCFGITRASIRSHLFVANSFATMSIIPLVLLLFATSGATLLNLCVAWLAVEAIRRIFFAFSSDRRHQAVFTSMLALGMLPLMDSSLFIVVCALPLLLISLRSSLRDVVIATTGMTLPIFTYAYIVWCGGGEFVATLAMFFERMVETTSVNVVDTMTVPQIVAGGIFALLGIFSVVLYLRNSMSMLLATRLAWRFIISSILILSLTLLLLPSASVAMLVLVTLLVGITIPMFLLRLSTPLAALIYVLMLGCAIVYLVA